MSGPFLAQLIVDDAARAVFFDGMGTQAATDLTDGLRVTFAGGDILAIFLDRLRTRLV